MNPLNGHFIGVVNAGSEGRVIEWSHDGTAVLSEFRIDLNDPDAGDSDGFRPQDSQILVYSLAGPVPEPSTWALWLAGLAGLGLATRSRTRAA